MIRTILTALLIVAAAPEAAQPAHSPQCAGAYKADEGAERSQGPWDVTCYQEGRKVWSADGLYAFCRLQGGSWRFQGWYQREGGEALIVPDSPAALCVWRQSPPPQPAAPRR